MPTPGGAATIGPGLTSAVRKERHPMGCLLAIFAGAFPRIALVIFWLARPDRMDAIFTSFVWPVLGIIFLPFTTLIYVLLWQFPQGVTGWDWLWIAIAFLLDISHWAATASQRNQIPGRTAV
jgi:hypothetical protein